MTIVDIEKVTRRGDHIEIVAVTDQGTQTILIEKEAARRLVALLYKAIDDQRSMW